jgi:hypothetical protein
LTEESLPEKTAVYEIKIIEIPKTEREELKAFVDKELEEKLAEIKSNEKIKLTGRIKFNSNWTDSIYSTEERPYLQVEVRAKCNDYKALTGSIDRIFSGLSILNDGLYSPHSIRRSKNFEDITPRSRPVGL